MQSVVERVEALRRQRLTGKTIAAEAGVSPATMCRVLQRLGLNRLSALEPQPVRSYEREHPGELIHIDIKLGKFGRIDYGAPAIAPVRVGRAASAGSVYVYVDDASRAADGS